MRICLVLVAILISSVEISAQYRVHVVVPQTRSFVSAGSGVEVAGVNVTVSIVEQVATTTMDLVLTNTGGIRLESQLVLPVPAGSVLRGFTFQGSALEAKAELLERDVARRTYDEIVSRVRDPALLEFLGCNLIRSSVFPVEARGGQRVRVTYEHLLSRDRDRVDYVLPRSESIEYRVPWQISVQIRAKSPISTVYSASHQISTKREGEQVVARLMDAAALEPGPFRLSYLLRESEMAATLLAYPDAKVGGGYFLLLAGAPARPAKAEPMKREVILVLDRSGSMAGEKLEQVRAAALQVLEGLADGESFNIIAYHEAVELFAPAPVIKDEATMREARNYIRTLRVRGGTNIHDALLESLRMRTTPGTLPLVLFLTDGLPTIGQTSEKSIRELVQKGNPHQRRVFTFGVGLDVNTPLLDRIALQSRAAASFVLPREDVEVKVGEVFARLSEPLLANPELQVSSGGGVSFNRVRDLMPGRLHDVFEGDQLVVLGQYSGEEPLEFKLAGTYGGKERTFRFRFDLDRATTRNAFVPRLWANRKIAFLTDAIRDLGADGGSGTSDPRLRELVDEVVRLSREFGILSEYTAFLAREGTDLHQTATLLSEALTNFDNRGLKTRTGLDSTSQSLNNSIKRSQMVENRRNVFFDAYMNTVGTSTVQQVSNGAFYKQGNRWIDSSLLEGRASAPRVVEFGSAEFRRLAERLTAENRQSTLTLKGEILLRDGEETILVR